MSIILITGAAGFIGSHLQDKLIDLGHTVVGIDNLSTGNLSNLNSKTIFINKDICDDLTDIFNQYQFDYVFHLAAQINLRDSIRNPKHDAYINIIGSLNLIEQSARIKVKKFIFSSTGGAIYSPAGSLPFTEQSIAIPESPYGLAKLTVENYLEFFKKAYGLNSTILRYANVFGPRQNAKGEAGVISIFIENILNGKELVVFGDGKQTRDFIYVDDVVRANVLTINTDMKETFNISSNRQTSVNSIIEKLEKITNIMSHVKYTDAIPGELKDSRLSYEKIKNIGWSPIFDIDKALSETIGYFSKGN